MQLMFIRRSETIAQEHLNSNKIATRIYEKTEMQSRIHASFRFVFSSHRTLKHCMLFMLLCLLWILCSNAIKTKQEKKHTNTNLTFCCECVSKYALKFGITTKQIRKRIKKFKHNIRLWVYATCVCVSFKLFNTRICVLTYTIASGRHNKVHGTKLEASSPCTYYARVWMCVGYCYCCHLILLFTCFPLEH